MRSSGSRPSRGNWGLLRLRPLRLRPFQMVLQSVSASKCVRHGMKTRGLRKMLGCSNMAAVERAAKCRQQQALRSPKVKVPEAFVKNFISRAHASLAQAGVKGSLKLLKHGSAEDPFVQRLCCQNDHHVEHFFRFFDRCMEFLAGSITMRSYPSRACQASLTDTPPICTLHACTSH